MVIEAAGFEALLGGSADDEEEQEIMAGMSSVLLDVQLRPVTFFQGYTDLMTKVLMSSGEPITIVKGNMLLMDHQQVLALHFPYIPVMSCHMVAVANRHKKTFCPIA